MGIVFVADRAFLNRYGMMEHVAEEMTDEKVCFIHNHKIVRATKVYINIYHLWQKWINRECIAGRSM